MVAYAAADGGADGGGDATAAAGVETVVVMLLPLAAVTRCCRCVGLTNTALTFYYVLPP